MLSGFLLHAVLSSSRAVRFFILLLFSFTLCFFSTFLCISYFFPLLIYNQISFQIWLFSLGFFIFDVYCMLREAHPVWVAGLSSVYVVCREMCILRNILGKCKRVRIGWNETESGIIRFLHDSSQKTIHLLIRFVGPKFRTVSRYESYDSFNISCSF